MRIYVKNLLKGLKCLKIQVFRPERCSGKGLKALIDCFTFKLALEGFSFQCEPVENPNGIIITVSKCPWLELMAKSGRDHLAGKVGTTICNTDCAAWAAEFGDNIKFELHDQICRGYEHCILRFSD